MPRGLKRFQATRRLHFTTFSCYGRRGFFRDPKLRSLFEVELELTRRQYQFVVLGYVVMPEHVHLLIGEPQRDSLAVALQMLKQNVARKARQAVPALKSAPAFWQRRYFDFNVWTEKKRVEKLRYIHRNPVTRGLVARPEDWAWSSFRHYATGEFGMVEIESQWTARHREHVPADRQ